MKKYVLTGLMLIIAAAMYSQTVQLRRANKLYRDGKYEEAASAYSELRTMRTGDIIARYNLGNAYYRMNKFAEAAQLYDEVVATDPASSIKQKALYNKGLAHVRQQQFAEGVSAFKTALMLDPSDNDTRINLQKALEELRKKQPPPPAGQKNKKKETKQNKEQNQNQIPKSELSKKEIERLLKGLQQKEQQVQQKMQQNKQRSAGQQEKDW